MNFIITLIQFLIYLWTSFNFQQTFIVRGRNILLF